MGAAKPQLPPHSGRQAHGSAAAAVSCWPGSASIQRLVAPFLPTRCSLGPLRWLWQTERAPRPTPHPTWPMSGRPGAVATAPAPLATAPWRASAEPASPDAPARPSLPSLLVARPHEALPLAPAPPSILQGPWQPRGLVPTVPARCPSMVPGAKKAAPASRTEHSGQPSAGQGRGPVSAPWQTGGFPPATAPAAFRSVSLPQPRKLAASVGWAVRTGFDGPQVSVGMLQGPWMASVSN